MALRFPVVLEPAEWTLFQSPGSIEILSAHGRSTSPALRDAQLICLIPHLSPFLLRKRTVEMIEAEWLSTNVVSPFRDRDTYEKCVRLRASSLLPRGAKLAEVAISILQASPDAQPEELLQEPGREHIDSLTYSDFVCQHYDLPLEFSIDYHFATLLKRMGEEGLRANLRDIAENLITDEPDRPRPLDSELRPLARGLAKLKSMSGQPMRRARPRSD